MKLTKENERVVYLGGKNEDLGWGWIQFPHLYNMADGNIGLYVHDEYDSWVSIDGENTGKYFVSKNKGLSWIPATKEDTDKMGTILPNGDVLRSLNNPLTSLKGVKKPKFVFGKDRTPSDSIKPTLPDDPTQMPPPITPLVNVWGSVQWFYWLDTIPDNIIEKRFRFQRLRAGESSAEIYYTMPNWKARTVESFEPEHPDRDDLDDIMLNNAGLYKCRVPVVAPDGSLYIAHYRNGAANPFTGIYDGKHAAFILHSTDNGENWSIHGYIPYKYPDTEKDELGNLRGGFCEPCIEFMPDGSMLCILRTCDVFQGTPEWGPTYLSRSTDGGRTWSKPEYFKDRGAFPQLLQLKNGITLAVITRPGIYVYASNDCGKTWTAELEIMTGEDRSGLANVPPEKPNFHQWAGSCCNCTILPLADDKALLAFSDFYTPDGQGIKRKGIKTIEITAENN